MGQQISIVQDTMKQRLIKQKEKEIRSNNVLSCPVNYDCYICMQSGKPPNISGRFHMINDSECKCNGCNAIFDKSKYFNTVVDNAELC